VVHIAIHGASGRNGRRLIPLVLQDPRFRLAAAIVGPTSKLLGEDAAVMCGLPSCGIANSATWPAGIEVVVDFSNAKAAIDAVNHCRDRKIPIVVASTGLNAQQEADLREASAEIPICYSANFSPAVNLTMKLAQQAAQVLAKIGQQVDVEIIERHHRMKEDSPSGTALRFGQMIAPELGLTQAAHGREGMVGKRPANEIGYHAVRLGDDAGQHTICFGMMGELIELRCAASNRDPYASGALTASLFLMDKKSGLFDMFDVLGLRS
jgi:4-hydroxy-tetrahydrodipicolinate reductase